MREEVVKQLSARVVTILSHSDPATIQSFTNTTSSKDDETAFRSGACRSSEEDLET